MLIEQHFRKEIRSNSMEFMFAFSGKHALNYLKEHNQEAVLILSDSGFMNTDDNLGTSKTAPHEVGHGYGLLHSAGDQRGNGQPDK